MNFEPNPLLGFRPVLVLGVRRSALGLEHFPEIYEEPAGALRSPCIVEGDICS
jgi:hypothetical protein